MKRRIDLLNDDNETQTFKSVLLQECDDYFVVDVPFDNIRKLFNDGPRRCYKDGSTAYKMFDGTFFNKTSVRWKPHEYLQETRRACLVSYWIFKKLLGKDLAGLIAKYVYSTRFDEIWENEEEEN